jgi:hypothetical protein
MPRNSESHGGSNPISPRGRIRTTRGASRGRPAVHDSPTDVENNSPDDGVVCAGSAQSENCRMFKEMNFAFAHQSSNPICPATESVSTVGFSGVRYCCTQGLVARTTMRTSAIEIGFVAGATDRNGEVVNGNQEQNA